MEFTASDGEIISELNIREELGFSIKILKKEEEAYILSWEKELLEWYLDKTIEDKIIRLHRDITENELEQLKQLRDYLEL